MKVLIVGSEGYLGSRLVPHLQAKGHECTSIDAGFFASGTLYGETEQAWSKATAQSLTLEDVEKHDVVVYLAAISNDPLKNLSEESLYGPVTRHTLRVAEFCRQTGTRFVFPSSCSVFGFSAEIVDEQSPPNPRTPYSANKLEIERGLEDLASENFRPIALRFATVYGLSSRMRFDLVTNMFAGMALVRQRIELNSDGLAMRPHLHIDDAIAAFSAAISFEPPEPRLFVVNVGAEKNNMAIRDLAELVSGLSGAPVMEGMSSDAPETLRDRKIRDGRDSRSYQVSFAKFREYFPQIAQHRSLDVGVAALLEELRTHELTPEVFARSEFYRLQHLEKLVSSGAVGREAFADPN